MAARGRKSRFKVRIFWSDVVGAFWAGFFTCLILMAILWGVSGYGN